MTKPKDTVHESKYGHTTDREHTGTSVPGLALKEDDEFNTS